MVNIADYLDQMPNFKAYLDAHEGELDGRVTDIQYVYDYQLQVFNMVAVDKDGETVLEAEGPMAEMTSYAIDLRSMTQSRGQFTFAFVRYEDCPPAAQEKAIAEAKALAGE